MTIKQQGGIFGRNPTFQDLSVDGSVTVPNDSISGDAIDGGHATPENITVGDTINTEWLGVNIADPVGRLHVNDPSGTYINMKFSHTGSGTTATDGFDIIYAGNDAYFTNRESGPFHWYIGGGEKLRLETNGNANLISGNLIVANGKGIDFSATSGTGTSELFDDYEEGTWTPVPADAASGGNTGTTVSVEGIYTKVGNTVFVQFGLLNINTTGLTAGNDFYIQGLPYAAGNTTLTSYATGACIPSGNISYTGELVAAITDNKSAIRLAETVSGGNVDYITVSELTSGGSDIWASLVYRTA